MKMIKSDDGKDGEKRRIVCVIVKIKIKSSISNSHD
jgi:hypothetical protein